MYLYNGFIMNILNDITGPGRPGLGGPGTGNGGTERVPKVPKEVSPAPPVSPVYRSPGLAKSSRNTYALKITKLKNE